MLAFLYHRVGEGKYANPFWMMEKHFAWLAKKHRTVLPGDPLRAFQLDVCLTFDDATFDFYHYVFPLLKRYNLKAVLSVPVYYILESSDVDPDVRLAVPYSSAMKGDTYRTHAPFCTWAEIREMAQSGYVQVASHSVHHQNMLLSGLDLELEIVGSKRLLEEKLHMPIRTFVYPLGKFNRNIHRMVKRHYEFAMRIGTAWNTSWQNQSGIIYRIISDNLLITNQHFSFRRKISYGWFYLLNSLRRR